MACAALIPEGSGRGAAKVDVQHDAVVEEGLVDVAEILLDGEVWQTPTCGIGVAILDVVGLESVGPAPHADGLAGPFPGVYSLRQ